MTVRRTLYGSAAGLGILALILQVAPTPLPSAHASTPAIAVRARPLVSTAGHAAPDYEPIVRTNLFSAERTPPRQRFAPAGTASRDTVPRRAAPSIRLYGITVGAQGAMALIDADPEIPGAEIYHVGDVVAGAPIAEITDSTVVLSQPSGPRVLHLPRSSRKPQ